MHQWLLFAQKLRVQAPHDWLQLNQQLSHLSVIAGNQFSLADMAMYASLYIPFVRFFGLHLIVLLGETLKNGQLSGQAKLSEEERLEYYHVTRYFDLIQHRVIQPRKSTQPLVTRLLSINPDSPVKMAVAAEQAEAKDSKKKDKKSAQQSEDKGSKKEKSKDGKKEPEKPSGPVPSQLDIRVGKVISVKRHPDADALYVEQVDLGEENPRTVVSGLVKHMPPEGLDQKLVLLLCNLKPAKMRGVESQAMVLTAEALDGSKVELLAPPSQSKPGDVAYFEGFKGTPEAVLTPKKKIWETLQAQLKTNDALVPVYTDTSGKSYVLKTDSGEVKAQSVAGGKIK